MASNEKQNSKTRSDSFKQKKGDIYQFAMAVKICLESKNGERIQIEHEGDISSDKLYSFEIKQYEANFTLQCDQFWNTLYNWIIDIDIFKYFSKLIILTTSDTKDVKYIYQWNETTKEKKYQILNDLEPAIRKRKNVSLDKIKALDKIFTFNKEYTKEDLLNILEKVNIIIRAPKANEINNILSDLECFKYDSMIVKKRLIDAAKSFVLDKGLNNDKWVIETSEFHRDLRELKENRKYKLCKIDELESDELLHFHEYQFIKELKKINIDKEAIEEAIQNYFIASGQINDIISEFPNSQVYKNSLDRFSNDLLRNLRNIKQLSRAESKSEIANYYNSLLIHLKEIELIENDDQFQIGNIHKIVDEKNHNWKYENK